MGWEPPALPCRTFGPAPGPEAANGLVETTRVVAEWMEKKV